VTWVKVTHPCSRCCTRTKIPAGGCSERRDWKQIGRRFLAGVVNVMQAGGEQGPSTTDADVTRRLPTTAVYRRLSQAYRHQTALCTPDNFMAR